jgi:putative colanic acid biosynthesis UDP-glucose lipid carrier transferase
MIIGRRNFTLVRAVADGALILISFVAAAAIAQPWHILPDRPYMFFLPPLLAAVWYFSANVTGFYEDFNSRFFPYQAVYIVKNVLVQAGAAIVFIFAVKEDLYTRNFIVAFSVLLGLLTGAGFLLLRGLMRRQKEAGQFFRSLLIVGAGPVGREFREIVEKDITLGYAFAGFLDDDAANRDAPGVLGGVSRLEAVIREKGVDEVVIALPGGSSGAIDAVMRVCNRLAVRTHIIPDYFQFLARKFRVSLVGNFPVITVRSEPLEEFHWRLIKRSFDVAAALGVIVCVASWLFPILIVLQKLLSPGPVFYVQDRVGKSNRIFRCYKFRSMVTDAAGGEYDPARENDPRITRFGRFLRRTNLDELPQIVNVLLGDMSVVGPRPHAVSFNARYEEYIEELRLRSLVKPGITGWAQIHGLRGDVGDEEENRARIRKRFEYDIWYVENWTFGLDVQIILLTAWSLLGGGERRG